MSAHTEGPWTAVGPDMFGDWNILHPADSLAVSAVVANMRPPEEVEANARLIAAAPEMRRALGEIAFLINSGALRQFEGESWIDRVHAAIAKAEGRP